MDLVLAPDVFVNASVAPGEPPDRVAQRVLGKPTHKVKTTKWILDRTKAMLLAHPGFKKDQIDAHVALITGLVDVLEVEGDFKPEEWAEALSACAKKAGLDRVVTDHPDLLEKGTHDGVEFLSTENLLVEFAVPPPTPPPPPMPPKA